MRLGARRLFALLALVTVWFWAVAAVAQEEQEERSRFIRFVERQISTPDRQIRLGTIEGALSSDVRIEDITISDRDGVWLRIEDVHLIWNRRALLSRRLDIELLEAERIAVTRAPLPAEGASEPFEEPEFQLPELPAVLHVDAVRVPEVDIAPGVLSAQDYELSVDGSVELDSGALDADLDIVRTDGSGALALEAAFSNETRVLDLDFLLTEPENGIVANLLNLEGRPAVTFAITGAGPIASFVADIALTADGEELLAGEAGISRTTAGGFRFLADVGGDLQRLVPPLYRELVGAGSRLKIDATRTEDGAIDFAEAELRSGVALLEFSGALAADGSPLALDLQATLDAPNDTPVYLPGGDGESSVQYGRIAAQLNGEDWSANFDLQGLATAMLTADAATADAEGTVTDLGDPAARQVSFSLDANVRGLGSGDPDLSAALGEAIGLQAVGAWAAGEPVQIAEADLRSPTVSLGFTGTVDPDGATGDFAITLPELARFSGLAGRPLAGDVTLAATGSAQFSGERLALTLDGEAQNLDLGVASLGALLHGRTTLSGAIARDEAGSRFDAFRIESPQLSLIVDGGPIGPDSQINATLEIADASAIAEGASGAVTLTAAVTGTPAAAGVDAVLKGEDLVLAGRSLDEATGRFTGTVAGTRVNGSLTARGTLESLALEASAGIATDPDGRHVLQDLQVTAGDSRLSGELALLPQALLEGRLALQSEDVATLAPLLLTPASGAVTAEIALSSEDGAQAAAITAEIDNLDIDAAGGIAVSSATADLSVTDLFDAPLISGVVSSADLQIGDFVLRSLTLASTRDGDVSTWDLSAGLADGTLTSSGRLEQEDEVYRVSVDTLQVSSDGVEADLAAPLTLLIGDGRATVEGGILVVGEGRIAFSGDLGAARTAQARFDALPLDILNAFLDDLAASGTLSGVVSASGSAATPAINFDLQARDVSFALLDLVGFEPLAAEAEGHYEGGTLTVDAEATVEGRLVTLRGDVGDKLDVTLGAAALPLALLDAVAPQLGLGGTVSAELHATGSLAAPEASFNVTGSDLTAAPLRAAGVPGLGLEAAGDIRGSSLALSQAVVSIGDGRIAFSGTAGETLDLAYDISGLPLSLASGLAPGLGLEGQVSGTGIVEGAVLEPRITFNVQGRAIATAQLQQAGLPAVSLDAEGVFADGVAALDRAVATIGEGRIELAGTAGTELDLNATLVDISLALAGVFLPVALEGDLSGTAEIRGFLLDPVVSFDLETPALTTPVLRAEGVPTMALAVQGNYASGSATLEEAALTVGEGRMAVTGTLGTEIDANITATAIPLWITRAVLPDLELRGTLSGSASAQGLPGALRARFDLQATQVSAAPLAAAGLGPAEATVVGSYGDGAFDLQTARIAMAQGLAELNGRIASQLDLTLSLEDFPAAAANALRPGLGLAGVLSGTLYATGPAEDPILNFDLRGAGIRGEPLRTVPVP